MLDPRLLKKDLRNVLHALMEKRGLSLDIENIALLEQKRKSLQIHMEEQQSLRNRYSREIAVYKSKGQDDGDLRSKAAEVNQTLRDDQEALEIVQHQLNDIFLELPNLPHSSVPVGSKEEDNKEMRRLGTPRSFDFPIQDHADLGVALGMLDFEQATQIASSRFVVMHGAIARLHRALIQFMLDIHITEHGYQEVNVPYMVNSTSMRGTGQLPKFEADLFHVVEHDLYLIPTAEVPVTNLAAKKIIDAAVLPLKYVCHSPCFRSEAGSYGKDTRGMIRQHQFEKVELVQLTRPSESYERLEELTEHAEQILQRLELPYRVVTLCTADLGFSAAKTYDLEVWLPSQQRYREISSCSNFEAFQARRMMARWRNPAGNTVEPLHTLNGSALAVGRTLVAVMENYQQKDGSITIPSVLQRYMNEQASIAR